jgi:hypothetical protein
MSLGIHDRFIAGALKCFFCKTPIDWNNLHSIFPAGGDVKVSCTNPECVDSLSIYSALAT